MKTWTALFFFAFLFISPSFAQEREKIDTSAIAKIRDEGWNRSQIKDILWYISEVYGPRLAGSPQYNEAAKWAAEKMKSIGLENAHLEAWGPFGKSWELKKYSATVLGRQIQPLNSYPKAWSPGLKGKVEAEVVYLDADSAEQLQQYKGKLKGKFVLLSKPGEVEAYWKPLASREPDSSLLKLANADFPSGRGWNFQLPPAWKKMMMLNYEKWQFIMNENPAAVLTSSFSTRNLGGSIGVQQAYVPNHPDTSFMSPYRVQVQKANAPKIPPQIEVGGEAYNRLVRLAQRGEKVKLAVELEVAMGTKDENSYNIIGEIPGTDLKNEVVMIGGHFDSWHGGTGATDNGTGSAVCLEAMRILKAAGLQPRRTIRIGLWGAEEQGLLGSEAYVKEHFGTKDSLKPDAEKFAAYFNNDNGSGKVRGVYMQGNEAVRPIFRAWLAPFKDMGASTLTLQNTGGTDHLSFDAIGLPGFQFIQDEIEYESRTHHTTMDLFDRVQIDDIKQAAIIMAAFAYNAAMRDEKLPHKPEKK
ncbi:MAG: M20/M25/M40 family metallo-hydrolase [Bacteroidetes bacterium]|nr:M20/M25/M40 family metallo-hydrolase [Bacteroidota bacterium]